MVLTKAEKDELFACNFCGSTSTYFRKKDNVRVCNRCGQTTPITTPNNNKR